MVLFLRRLHDGRDAVLSQLVPGKWCACTACFDARALGMRHASDGCCWHKVQWFEVLNFNLKLYALHLKESLRVQKT